MLKIQINKEGLTILYNVAKDGDAWTLARIGERLEVLDCGCEHDCCGHTFTQYTYTRFFGLVQVMRYGVNV